MRLHACGTCGEAVPENEACGYSSRVPRRPVRFHLACSPDELRKLARLLDGPHEQWWLDQSQKLGRLKSGPQIHAVLRAARAMRAKTWVFPHPPAPEPRPKRPQIAPLATVGPKPRRPAVRNSAHPTAPSGRKSFAVHAAGGTFRVRWIRHKPFLYQVHYKGAAGHSRPVKKPVYLGRVHEAAAIAGAKTIAHLIESGALPIERRSRLPRSS